MMLTLSLTQDEDNHDVYFLAKQSNSLGQLMQILNRILQNHPNKPHAYIHCMCSLNLVNPSQLFHAVADNFESNKSKCNNHSH